MARIIGGIGTSHVPTIGMAFDKGKQGDPDWRPLFRAYEPVARWLAYLPMTTAMAVALFE